jgi:hypothetical protein
VSSPAILNGAHAKYQETIAGAVTGLLLKVKPKVLQIGVSSKDYAIPQYGRGL